MNVSTIKKQETNQNHFFRKDFERYEKIIVRFEKASFEYRENLIYFLIIKFISIIKSQRTAYNLISKFYRELCIFDVLVLVICSPRNAKCRNTYTFSKNVFKDLHVFVMERPRDLILKHDHVALDFSHSTTLNILLEMACITYDAYLIR